MSTHPFFDPASPQYDKAGNEFYAMVGICVSRWAFIDREIYKICLIALKLDEKHLSFFYYRLRGFNQRVKFADDAIRALLEDQTPLEAWKALLKRIDTLSQTRNIIAHQPPIHRKPKNKDDPNTWSIRIEPYSVAIDANHRGLMGKDRLYFSDLVQHHLDAADLQMRIEAFRLAISK